MSRLRKNQIYQEIVQNPLQSLLLLIAIAILSGFFLGGVLIGNSLRRGMSNLERRLGADLMLVPASAEELAEDILIEGARGSFYFDSGVYDKVSSVSGVKEITPQFFLKSLAASCCSSEVKLVYYDPETDFLIKPWISQKIKNRQNKFEAVVGSSIDIDENSEIKLFGKQYKVAARLAKTGTSIDNSVYFTFDSVPAMLEDAEKSGVYIPDSQKEAGLVSSIFINIDENSSTDEVIRNIHSAVKSEIGIIYPKKMAQSVALNITGVEDIIGLLIVLVVVTSFIIMFILHLFYANEKKKEISLYRILGATRGNIKSVMYKEAAVLSIAGSLAGCAIATLVLIPFEKYIA